MRICNQQCSRAVDAVGEGVVPMRPGLRFVCNGVVAKLERVPERTGSFPTNCRLGVRTHVAGHVATTPNHIVVNVRGSLFSCGLHIFWECGMNKFLWDLLCNKSTLAFGEVVVKHANNLA